MSVAKFLDPAELARLQGLDIKARSIVEGYVSGLHKSPFHGFSVEFAEHREYVPGDDLRYVDWRVYGKSDRYYLKQFEEETNFACHVLLDASESMLYKSEKAAMSKLDYAKCVAAAIGYMVLRQQDAVGLVTFDERIRELVRASSQASHLGQICHILENTPARGETSVGSILGELAERFPHRSLVVLISDLFDDTDRLMHGLKHLLHGRHDVLVLQVIDPDEEDFPFREPTLFKGLENLPSEQTDPRALREAYRAEFGHFLRSVKGICQNLELDYALLRTDAPLGLSLSAFLARRRRK